MATTILSTSSTSTVSTTPSSTSNTVSNATNTAAPAMNTPIPSTMSTGAKAGVGVGVAAAGVAAIGLIIFLLRRRKARKQTSELTEKAEAGNSSPDISKNDFDHNDAYAKNKDLPQAPLPGELGTESRVELGGDMHGHAVELDPKGGSSVATELPTSRD
ncbi:hypothetical protein H2198_008447 [Neophaeococcomyces mojaviensis]|uniref:Uncharacterized protein n=1 Tax=Neophaeococcomyces mojaviensis TaxID=3383035 RepID=A0ACC2ZXD0_9EURO|nr:hypothetical protein H2198_008447 [Knufia sp. JES_112]